MFVADNQRAVACFYSLFLLLATNVVHFVTPTLHISIAIDAHNNEIIYEGLRLLKSIEIFGGALNDAVLDVCIATERGFANPRLLSKLHQFNISSIRYSDRYSLPSYSPTLNKLCSFEYTNFLNIQEDYFLYLDADIFVAQDPTDYFEQFIAKTRRTRGGVEEREEERGEEKGKNALLCGRPWNTFGNLPYFPQLVETVGNVNVSGTFYPLHEHRYLETISPGGNTFYGMCNTGMYFMPASILSTFSETMKTYLSFLSEVDATSGQAKFQFPIKTENSEYLSGETESSSSSSILPFPVTDFGIDSIIMWAAQYTMRIDVHIAPVELNYIASAENMLRRFVNVDGYEGLNYFSGNPSLIHFSKGSHLLFTREQAEVNSVCDIVLKGQYSQPNNDDFFVTDDNGTPATVVSKQQQQQYDSNIPPDMHSSALLRFVSEQLVANQEYCNAFEALLSGVSFDNSDSSIAVASLLSTDW